MNWEHKKRFPIQDRMVDIIKLSRQTAEVELAAARRKLRKLQYGS